MSPFCGRTPREPDERQVLLHQREQAREAVQNLLALWETHGQTCEEMSHLPSQYHHYGEPCPVEEEANRVVESARAAIHG